MKTILLPFRSNDQTGVPLELAYSVAERFGSYVEGLFVRQPPPLVSGEGISIPADYITELEDEARQASERAREAFTGFMSQRNVPFTDVRSVSDGPSAGWRDAEGFEGRVVGEHGRLFDLIVVGCPGTPSGAVNEAVCEAALFDSGRPVLMAPAELPATLSQTVVIAWNGSTETARTIGLAMPFLQGAGHVIVLTVEGATVSGPGPDEVADHLVRNGVNAEAKTVQSERRAGGEVILEECRAAGADLLLKGAFTHSRLRQMIFGGVTSYILEHADLPVLMAH